MAGPGPGVQCRYRFGVLHLDWVPGSYIRGGVPRRSGAHGWLAAETAPALQGLRYSGLGRHAALLVVAEAAPSRSLFRYGRMDWRTLQVAGRRSAVSAVCGM